MTTLRRLAEITLRGTYWKRKLPSPFDDTSIYVTPDAALQSLRFGSRGFDTRLLAIVDSFVRTGDIVWDIGANQGIFGFAASSKVGRRGQVLLVEPDIWMAHLLNKSRRICRNRGRSVLVLPAAISSDRKLIVLNIAARGRASNYIDGIGDRVQAGGVRDRQPIAAVSMNDLLTLTGNPNFVKIDVEGAEALVLEGGQAVLQDARPTIFCEVSAEHRDFVTGMLRDTDYALFDPFIAEDLTPIVDCVLNTLAIPREKVS